MVDKTDWNKILGHNQTLNIMLLLEPGEEIVDFVMFACEVELQRRNKRRRDQSVSILRSIG